MQRSIEKPIKHLRYPQQLSTAFSQKAPTRHLIGFKQAFITQKSTSFETTEGQNFVKLKATSNKLG